MFGLQILAQRSAIFFTENKHQWDDNIRFRCQLYKGYLYAEQDGLTYYFLDEKNSKPHHGSFSIPQETIEQQLKEFMETGEQTIPDMQDHEKPDSLRAHAYKVLFTGMNKKVRIQGERETGYTENYMTGNDPHRWATNVKSFNGVNYENIYKNIDLHLYGNTYDLKYDYIIHPGGNPQNIKMEYTYVPSMKVQNDGTLVITTSVNEVYEQKPFAYQLIENDTIEIPCSYKLDNFTVSYELGNYNKNYDLYIDPELIFKVQTGILLADKIPIYQSNFDHMKFVNNSEYHYVKSGDTLSAIARKYRVSVKQICDLNGITEKTILRIGMRLRLR